ncbi:MAG: Cys-tRNA(Pro) deacylase [Ignavibacteria bacterium]|nr:Cys-tRNA(Pro) deacylase [Ignavibacteria bacterium]
MKTNAVRILESKSIAHSIIQYEFSEDEIDAITVANKIGVDADHVFKTLVTRNEKNEIVVFLIPSNFELNLKKAAKASRSKHIEMIKMKEIQPLTGYIRGGCSPIGMKKNFESYIDETAQLYNDIYVSAGIRGMQIKISPSKLKEVINAQFYDII